jgi:EAL domain-containing protein (putative c-di-GMP-specific phosphodiesterase class I)
MLDLARSALKEERVIPFYQPKVSLRTGELCGFEALLRWRHPSAGLRSPDEIKAAFQDQNLACALSDRMIDQVLRDISRWRDQGLAWRHVAINAAAAEFRSGRFAERLLDRLYAAALPTSAIQLEVTETVFLGRGAECVEQALKLLSREGVLIALDDFGTGYASLSHLKQFPVDIIKIDRSFIAGLHSDPDDGAIVAAVINLARSLNIRVVAEGIETEAQHNTLLALGCDFGQGFLYGHPAEPDVAAERMTSN